MTSPLCGEGKVEDEVKVEGLEGEGEMPNVKVQSWKSLERRKNEL